MATDKNIKTAMDAHTNLTMFSAIVALLESRCFYGNETTAARKIRAICLAEQQRQLRIMDKALENTNVQ